MSIGLLWEKQYQETYSKICGVRRLRLIEARHLFDYHMRMPDDISLIIHLLWGSEII